MAEQRVETRDVWQLARAVGIDIDRERNRFLLTQPEIAPSEAAELLNRTRGAIHQAFRAGWVRGVRSAGYGKRQIHYARPWDILCWAASRRETDRYVDRELAERYAAEDGRVPGKEDAVA